MTTYERYRAKGLCGKCGKKLMGDRKNKSLCATCQQKNSDYIMASVRFYKEHNLCPRCGKNLLYGEEKACPECRAKRISYEERRKITEEERVKTMLANKKRTDYRRKNKLCVDCGKPLTNKYVTCERCRAKRRIAAQRFRDRKKYGEIDMSCLQGQGF